jgi:hypothetical protein
VIETLPASERLTDKKSNKTTLKNKPNPAAKINYSDIRDNQDHRSPEQNLETYSKILFM